MLPGCIWPRLSEGPTRSSIRSESEGAAKSPVSAAPPDLRVYAPQGPRPGTGEQVGENRRSRACPTAFGPATSSSAEPNPAPTNGEIEAQRGRRLIKSTQCGLTIPGAGCGGTSAFRLSPSSFRLRAKGELPWGFKPCLFPQFGKLFLPQPGAARAPSLKST